MKPKRTLLDTAEPPSEEERRRWYEQDSKAWVERTHAGMTRKQQVQMEGLLKHKQGGQLKWTPEALATLAEQARQMRIAGLSPGTIHKRLAAQYRCGEKRIANLLSEIRTA